MSKYDDLIARKKNEYGKKFSTADLDKRFIKYFNSGERIKVNDYGRVIYGNVGVTTGFKPVFLMIRHSRQIGSSDVISKKTRIIAEQSGMGYKDL